MPFLVALVSCTVLTPVLAGMAGRIGLVDRPADDGLKIHAEPKALVGGIAIVIAVLAAAAAGGGLPSPWIVGAILLLLAVGVIDDAVGVHPFARLAVQFVGGVLLAVGGLTIEPLGIVGPAAVVVGVPALTNAVNITDGQDGLAAGLALIATLGISWIALPLGETEPFALATAGALLGFLLWNRPPARVFLGDGGAYAVGCLLVVLAVGSSGSWSGVLGTFVCLGPFVLELTSTVVRRARGKGSLVSGDRQHVYDVLARGVGRNRATLAMWLAAGLGVVLSRAVLVMPLAAAAAVVAAAVALAVVLVRSLEPREVRRST